LPGPFNRLANGAVSRNNGASVASRSSGSTKILPSRWPTKICSLAGSTARAVVNSKRSFEYSRTGRYGGGGSGRPKKFDVVHSTRFSMP
jgi:hypothetical protein